MPFVSSTSPTLSQFGYVLLGIGAATGGVVLVVVLSNQQEIPYTHRKHVVLTSSKFDQLLGTEAFNEVHRWWTWCTLHGVAAL